MSKWRKITCAERDKIWTASLRPGATLTDLEGRFGEPQIMTEWIGADADYPILRDVRWPGPEGARDSKPCEHYVPAPTEGDQKP